MKALALPVAILYLFTFGTLFRRCFFATGGADFDVVGEPSGAVDDRCDDAYGRRGVLRAGQASHHLRKQKHWVLHD